MDECHRSQQQASSASATAERSSQRSWLRSSLPKLLDFARVAQPTAMTLLGATVHVQSITDSPGNSYVAVMGADDVTLSFVGTASYSDIRIAEYSDMDTVSPLDIASSNTGSRQTVEASVPPMLTITPVAVGWSRIVNGRSFGS